MLLFFLCRFDELENIYIEAIYTYISIKKKKEENNHPPSSTTNKTN